MGTPKHLLLTELSHVVQVRAEGPKALSPGHRSGHYDNQQGRVGQNLRKLSYEPTLKVENDFDKND